MSGEELPEGWAVTTLQELSSSIQYGYTASADAARPGPRLLRITDIQDGRVDWATVPGCEISAEDLTKFELAAGDIVFARSGATTGKSFLIRECPQQAVFASYLIRVRAKADAVLPNFLSQYFGTPSYWSYIVDNLAGNAQPNCNGTKLAALTVPVPPLAEQRRIVEKVEALLGQVNRMKGRLERVSAILKRFRQSVLAAACSGELTPELDSSRWQEVRLGDVIRGFEAGRNLKCHGRAARDGEFGVLKISAVTWGAFRANENKCLLEGDTPKPHEIVRAGDLLITRANTVELVGAVVLVDRDYHNLMLPDKILRLSLNHERIDSHYLLYALRTDTVRDHFEREATGTSDSMRNLSQPKLSSAPLILPPLEDQRKVAALVTRLFTLADTIERRVQTAMARVEKLPQAILSKAFSGELVPTEAELARIEGRTYETAEALLARVRNEAGTTNTARKPARKRRGAKKTGGD